MLTYASMRRLCLAYNGIYSLQGLSAIKGPRYDLRVLDITDNRVSNIEEIRHLQGCVKLEQLTFKQVGDSLALLVQKYRY
jgi:hypothetical protein